MNILWLSHLVPYPPKGGVLQRSFNLVKELSRYHNIYLISFNQNALIKDDKLLDESVRNLKSYCKTVKVLNIPAETKKYGYLMLYIKSLFTKDPYTVNWLKSDRMLDEIKNITSRYNIDAVHFDTISLAHYIHMFDGYKKLLNHHNIESHMMHRRAMNESNVLKKLYMFQEWYKLRKYEKDVCDSFDFNVTCSSLDSERLISDVPGINVDDVPNGVDLNYFIADDQSTPKTLIFAGGMNWYPNQSAMLFFAKQVWPLLKTAIPDIKMTVVGQDPPKYLIDLSKKDKNFIVTGFVDDVRIYLNSASIYVCPITDGGGTKLKILDALSMGKAIVAHPIACEGIDVVENQTVLYAETANEYVNKIKSLIDKPDLHNTLSNNSIKLIKEKYSFVNIGKKLSDIYANL